jgi:hypothetical protein
MSSHPPRGTPYTFRISRNVKTRDLQPARRPATTNSSILPLPSPLSCPPVEGKEHTGKESAVVSLVTARSCKFFFYSDSRLLAVVFLVADEKTVGSLASR